MGCSPHILPTLAFLHFPAATGFGTGCWGDVQRCQPDSASALGCPGQCFVDDYFNAMLLVVVGELNCRGGLLFAIDDHSDWWGTSYGSPLHCNMVKSIPVAVVKLKRIPGAWQSRAQVELVHFQPQPEQCLDNQPI